MIPLAEPNTAPREDFTARLGGVSEGSPWVAEAPRRIARVAGFRLDALIEEGKVR